MKIQWHQLGSPLLMLGVYSRHPKSKVVNTLAISFVCLFLISSPFLIIVSSSLHHKTLEVLKSCAHWSSIKVEELFHIGRNYESTGQTSRFPKQSYLYEQSKQLEALEIPFEMEVQLISQKPAHGRTWLTGLHVRFYLFAMPEVAWSFQWVNLNKGLPLFCLDIQRQREFYLPYIRIVHPLLFSGSSVVMLLVSPSKSIQAWCRKKRTPPRGSSLFLNAGIN